MGGDAAVWGGGGRQGGLERSPQPEDIAGVVVVVVLLLLRVVSLDAPHGSNGSLLPRRRRSRRRTARRRQSPRRSSRALHALHLVLGGGGDVGGLVVAGLGLQGVLQVVDVVDDGLDELELGHGAVLGALRHQVLQALQVQQDLVGAVALEGRLADLAVHDSHDGLHGGHTTLGSHLGSLEGLFTHKV